jgi:hypothetical protein
MHLSNFLLGDYQKASPELWQVVESWDVGRPVGVVVMTSLVAKEVLWGVLNVPLP